MLSPFECLCGNFILPEPASYVFFYAFSNLRNLFYLIVSHPAKKLWDEDDLRAVDLKWDTIIHKEVSMRSGSLFNPTLTLHALGRNGFESEGIKYNVAVTIDAPKYTGSLYDAVLQTYQYLTPIEIRNINRLMV